MSRPGAQAPGDEARDCPHCEGERRREGAALSVGDGVFGLWRWHDVTPERDYSMSDHAVFLIVLVACLCGAVTAVGGGWSTPSGR